MTASGNDAMGAGRDRSRPPLAVWLLWIGGFATLAAVVAYIVSWIVWGLLAS